MNRWPLRLQLLLEGPLRWWLPLGLAASALIGLGSWLVPEARHQLQVQEAALQGLSRTATPAALPPQVSRTALQSFEGTLVDDSALAKLMRRIWQQAPEAGLVVSKIDYQMETDSAGQFRRMTLQVPMRGSYPAIRRFTFTLLADFPALSLDKLTLKREPGAGAQIEASAHLTLYQRP